MVKLVFERPCNSNSALAACTALQTLITNNMAA